MREINGDGGYEILNSLDKDILMQTNIQDLMIPAEKVAHVQIGNHLDHALLVLIKSGYTAVPVLDPQFRLHGLISKTLILDSILGIETIEVDKLAIYKVEDVMNENLPRLHLEDDFMKALGLTINHPFVCVVDDNNVFAGIITRRAILKLFTKHIHGNKN